MIICKLNLLLNYGFTNVQEYFMTDYVSKKISNGFNNNWADICIQHLNALGQNKYLTLPLSTVITWTDNAS